MLLLQLYALSIIFFIFKFIFSFCLIRSPSFKFFYQIFLQDEITFLKVELRDLGFELADLSFRLSIIQFTLQNVYTLYTLGLWRWLLGSIWLQDKSLAFYLHIWKVFCLVYIFLLIHCCFIINLRHYNYNII